MHNAVEIFWEAITESPRLFFLQKRSADHDERQFILLLAEFFGLLSNAEGFHWPPKVTQAILNAVELTYLLTTDYVRHLIAISAIRDAAWECENRFDSRVELCRAAAVAFGFFTAASRFEIDLDQVLRKNIAADIALAGNDILDAIVLLKDITENNVIKLDSRTLLGRA